MDIFLPDFNIGVEHDGPFHLRAKTREADLRKDALLRKQGIYLIRVREPFPFSVDREKAVVSYTYSEKDYTELERAIGATLELIAARTGEHRTVHIDVAADQTAILDQYRTYELENAIFAKVPEAKEYWDWEKNTLNPLYVTSGSGKKIHWKCPHGHQWTAPAAEFSRGGRCPVCRGRRVLAGFNDLAALRPDLAGQWHPTKNGTLTPEQVTARAGRRVWWRCERGHEWQATVASRSGGTGCPVCAGKRLLQGFNDLATLRPDLAAEWDGRKNGALTPQSVTAMSKRKAWWRCGKGHEWEASVSSRSRGSGCPYCAGKRALRGFNDLQTRNPRLAAQWHPVKNGGLQPGDVTEHAAKRVWWVCEKGHEWEAPVSQRSRGSGCPYCAGRLAIQGETDLKTVCPELAAEWHPTQNGELRPEDVTAMSERAVWWRCENGHSWKTAVANRTAGCGCPYCAGRRAVPGYNDLFTLYPGLQGEWDYEKNQGLHPRDLLPQSNRRVWWRCGRGHSWRTAVYNRTAGSGCPVCGGKQVLAGYNDLATVRPDLAREWHSEKNGDLTPEKVTAGSRRKVWWRCGKGHAWRASVANRNNGTGCPICSCRKTAPGVNDLATVNPELARQWHPGKNGGLTPQDVSGTSGKRAWWLCEKGHTWQASVRDRARGQGCPYCSGRRAVPGVNDLATLNPALAEQWHPQKNGALTPRDVKLYSNRKVWWQCKNGHEWQASVKSRTMGTGCAQCSGRRVVQGVTDLATTHPSLAREWNSRKNTGLTPRDVTRGSERKVWWRCAMGHEWEASICSRVRGAGCPVCRRERRPKAGDGAPGRREQSA